MAMEVLELRQSPGPSCPPPSPAQPLGLGMESVGSFIILCMSVGMSLLVSPLLQVMGNPVWRGS